MKLSRRVVGATVAFWTMIGAPAAVADDPGRFAGTYTYAGSAAEQKANRTAVDGIVQGLEPALRAKVKPMVEQGAVAPKTMIIALQGKLVGVQTPPAPMRLSPVDGTPVTVAQNGKKATLSRHFDNGKLVHEKDSATSKARSVLQLSADGQTLTVRNTVEMGLFKKPLVETWTYRRKR